MADVTLKRGDTLPVIRATLTNKTGTATAVAVDLTGSTVRFIMKLENGVSAKVDALATVVAPATSGVVEYAWTAVDTDTAGAYLAEWEVTDAAGKRKTFPTSTYHTVEVRADLGGA